MEITITAIFFAACAIAALASSLCTKGTWWISGILLLLGAGSLALIVMGPNDYLVRVPDWAQEALHPYILAPIGILFMILGLAGTAGTLLRCFLKRQMSSSE